MASLGSLVVQLAVDTARFQGDLGRAAAIAESRMRNIRDTARKTVAQLGAIGMAVGGALLVATKQGIDAADSMRDLAASAGTTVENMSRLGYAAQKSGTDLEVVKKALVKLAKEGAKDSVAALTTLAGEFAALPNSAAKSARAVEIFGERIGPSLIPLLNEGREGLAAMAAEADNLGVTISTGTAEAADQFNDRMVALTGAMTGFKNSLTAALLPTLNVLAQEMVKTAANTEAMDKAARAAATGLKILLVTGELIRNTFQQLGEGIGAVAAAIVTAAQGQWRQAWDIMKMSAEDGRKQTESSITRILDIIEGAGTEAQTKVAPFTAAIETIATTSVKAKKEVDKLGAALEEANRNTQTDFEKQIARWEQFEKDLELLTKNGMGANVAGNRRSEFIEEMLGPIEVTTKRITAGVQEQYGQLNVFAEQAARNMQTAFADFFYSFDGGLNNMLAGFADTLRRMVAELAAQELLMAFFSWGAGAFGGGIGKFFGSLGKGISGTRASGGPVSAGGMYLVGEKGPELLRMGSQSGTVIPSGGMGGGNVSISYQIDARGADADRIMAILPGLMKQTEQRSIAQIRDLISRGRLV